MPVKKIAIFLMIILICCDVSGDIVSFHPVKDDIFFTVDGKKAHTSDIVFQDIYDVDNDKIPEFFGFIFLYPHFYLIIANLDAEGHINVKKSIKIPYLPGTKQMVNVTQWNMSYPSQLFSIMENRPFAKKSIGLWDSCIDDFDRLSSSFRITVGDINNDHFPEILVLVKIVFNPYKPVEGAFRDDYYVMNLRVIKDMDDHLFNGYCAGKPLLGNLLRTGIYLLIYNKDGSKYELPRRTYAYRDIYEDTIFSLNITGYLYESLARSQFMGDKYRFVADSEFIEDVETGLRRLVDEATLLNPHLFTYFISPFVFYSYRYPPRVSVGIGDVNNDNSNELVIVQNNEILVYGFVNKKQIELIYRVEMTSPRSADTSDIFRYNKVKSADIYVKRYRGFILDSMDDPYEHSIYRSLPVLFTIKGGNERYSGKIKYKILNKPKNPYTLSFYEVSRKYYDPSLYLYPKVKSYDINVYPKINYGRKWISLNTNSSLIFYLDFDRNSMSYKKHIAVDIEDYGIYYLCSRDIDIDCINQNYYRFRQRLENWGFFEYKYDHDKIRYYGGVSGYLIKQGNIYYPIVVYTRPQNFEYIPEYKGYKDEDIVYVTGIDIYRADSEAESQRLYFKKKLIIYNGTYKWHNDRKKSLVDIERDFVYDFFSNRIYFRKYYNRLYGYHFGRVVDIDGDNNQDIVFLGGVGRDLVSSQHYTEPIYFKPTGILHIKGALNDIYIPSYLMNISSTGVSILDSSIKSIERDKCNVLFSDIPGKNLTLKIPIYREDLRRAMFAPLWGKSARTSTPPHRMIIIYTAAVDVNGIIIPGTRPELSVMLVHRGGNITLPLRCVEEGAIWRCNTPVIPCNNVRCDIILNITSEQLYFLVVTADEDKCNLEHIKALKKPGERCEKDLDCLTGRCLGKICATFPKVCGDGKCESDEVCSLDCGAKIDIETEREAKAEKTPEISEKMECDGGDLGVIGTYTLSCPKGSSKQLIQYKFKPEYTADYEIAVRSAEAKYIKMSYRGLGILFNDVPALRDNNVKSILLRLEKDKLFYLVIEFPENETEFTLEIKPRKESMSLEIKPSVRKCGDGICDIQECGSCVQDCTIDVDTESGVIKKSRAPCKGNGICEPHLFENCYDMDCSCERVYYNGRWLNALCDPYCPSADRRGCLEKNLCPVETLFTATMSRSIQWYINRHSFIKNIYKQFSADSSDIDDPLRYLKSAFIQCGKEYLKGVISGLDTMLTFDKLLSQAVPYNTQEDEIEELRQELIRACYKKYSSSKLVGKKDCQRIMRQATAPLSIYFSLKRDSGIKYIAAGSFWACVDRFLYATARTYVALIESGHDLDLHVVDSLGRHIGINPETGIFENQIPEAEFTGDISGRIESISLPFYLDYTVYVSSYEAEEEKEDFKLEVGFVSPDKREYKQKRFSIEKGEIVKFRYAFGDEISVEKVGIYKIPPERVNFSRMNTLDELSPTPVLSETRASATHTPTPEDSYVGEDDVVVGDISATATPPQATKNIKIHVEIIDNKQKKTRQIEEKKSPKSSLDIYVDLIKKSISNWYYKKGFHRNKKTPIIIGLIIIGLILFYMYSKFLITIFNFVLQVIVFILFLVGMVAYIGIIIPAIPSDLAKIGAFLLLIFIGTASIGLMVILLVIIGIYAITQDIISTVIVTSLLFYIISKLPDNDSKGEDTEE